MTKVALLTQTIHELSARIGDDARSYTPLVNAVTALRGAVAALQRRDEPGAKPYLKSAEMWLMFLEENDEWHRRMSPNPAAVAPIATAFVKGFVRGMTE